MAVHLGRPRPSRVKPAHAIVGPQHMYSIEIVNLSSFAVTVAEIGFTTGGSTVRTPRAAITAPYLLDNGPWPRRLEPRESVSLYFNPGDLIGQKIGRAYARTVCGEFEYGTSPSVEQLRGMLA